MAFGAGDEGVERGGPLGSDIMSGEEPVLPPNTDPAQGAFGGIVVDVEEALRGVDVQSLPLVEHVADGEYGSVLNGGLNVKDSSGTKSEVGRGFSSGSGMAWLCDPTPGRARCSSGAYKISCIIRGGCPVY